MGHELGRPLGGGRAHCRGGSGRVQQAATSEGWRLRCFAGAQWEKAQELFELMHAQHCTPDVVTYTALISACDRGGRWDLALQV